MNAGFWNAITYPTLLLEKNILWSEGHKYLSVIVWVQSQKYYNNVIFYMRHLNRNSCFRRKVEHGKTCSSHAIPPKTSSYFPFYSYVYFENRMKEKEQKIQKDHNK